MALPVVATERGCAVNSQPWPLREGSAGDGDVDGSGWVEELVQARGRVVRKDGGRPTRDWRPARRVRFGTHTVQTAPARARTGWARGFIGATPSTTPLPTRLPYPTR